MVLLMLMIASLILFDTGLSNVRALMAFRVPHYQKIAAIGWLVAGLIALYFQAAKNQGLVWGWFGLAVSFVSAFMVFLLALGCGAPLKRVISNEQIAPI